MAHRSPILIFVFAGVLMLSACSSKLDRCVEDRQNQYKKDHPEANYAELLDSRERFQKQCREDLGE